MLAEILYTCDFKHDDALHATEIPKLRTPRCNARGSGKVVFNYGVDDQIHAAVRSKLGLLEPNEIREGRYRLSLTISELAEQLGVADELLDKWEFDLAIQSRTVDNSLRVFFVLPNAMDVRTDKRRHRRIGELVG